MTGPGKPEPHYHKFFRRNNKNILTLEAIGPIHVYRELVIQTVCGFIFFASIEPPLKTVLSLFSRMAGLMIA